MYTAITIFDYGVSVIDPDRLQGSDSLGLSRVQDLARQLDADISWTRTWTLMRAAPNALRRSA